MKKVNFLKVITLIFIISIICISYLVYTDKEIKQYITESNIFNKYGKKIDYDDIQIEEIIETGAELPIINNTANELLKSFDKNIKETINFISCLNIESLTPILSNNNDFIKDYYCIEMSKIPMPNTIIIYYDNKTKSYSRDSMIFYEIIKMNNKRAICEEIGATYSYVDIMWSKKNEILIEYKYAKKGSIYFNLLKNEPKEEDFVWALVKYDEEICATAVYNGLENSLELVNYIYNLD